MPDILNEDGSCSDIKTIKIRSGDTTSYRPSSIAKIISSPMLPTSGISKSFADMMLKQQVIISALQVPQHYMSSIQSRGRTARDNSNSVDRYTVSRSFPFTVSARQQDESGIMSWFEQYSSCCIYYPTRMEAEKGSINLMIEYHKKQIYDLSIKSSKYKRKQKAFDGYHILHSSKVIGIKKGIEVLIHKLETIEEEHPEWLI